MIYEFVGSIVSFNDGSWVPVREYGSEDAVRYPISALTPTPEIDDEAMPVAQGGGNRYLRSVRLENASEATLQEIRHASRRRRINNFFARRNVDSRCQRREIRRNAAEHRRKAFM